MLVLGTVRLPVEALERARPVMMRMIAASRAEPGCLDYASAQDIGDPGLIRVSDLWSDRPARDAHFASAHIAEWRASWPDLGIHDRDPGLYEVDDPAPV